MKPAFRILMSALTALGLVATAFGQAGAPALSITGITASPSSAKPGDDVTLSLAVSNNGGAFTPAQTANFSFLLTNITTGYSFTVDASGVSPKTLIPAVTAGTETSAPTPGVGTFDVTITIPRQTTEAGPYRVSASGTAGSFSVSTAVVTVTGTPDLRITSVTYPAGVSYKGGDVIPMALTYTNMASSNATANVPFVPAASAPYFRIDVVLSTNPTFGDADDFILTFLDVFTKIDADNIDRTLTWNQLLPGNYAGSYYLLAKIDVLSKVEETTSDDDFTINGNNVWYDEAGTRIALQPTSFPTVYLASLAGTASGNNFSDNPVVTADGRYMAFMSAASNLVTGDTNLKRDIFVFDHQTSLVRRVNLSQQGAQANGDSANPAISSDGRLVAFASDATNLVFGDNNGFTDIFVVDTVTGVVVRESVATGGGQANGSSLRPAISSDGRYIVFESTATNLGTSVPVGVTQIYLRDRNTGTTTLVSQSGGAAGNNVSLQAAISGNGRYIAFASDATNLVVDDTNGVCDVFVRDTISGTLTRVSVDSGGGQANGASGAPSLNANAGDASDGRYVAFMSQATNLVAGDTNAISDIFVRDRVLNTTTRISLSTAGAEGVDPTNPTVTGSHLGSLNPSISATGRYVAFASLANNLTPGDGAGQYWPTDANGSLDVFVRDRDASGSGVFDVAGNVTTQMVSVNRFGYQTLRILGVPSTAASDIYPSISADGRWVAFPTDSDGAQGLAHTTTNRLSPDLNTFRDVFLFDRRINALPNSAVLPVVTITNPQAGSSYPVNTALTVNATATTTVGSVASVQFFVNGTSLDAVDTAFPYTATWTPTGMGTFTLSALVTDSFGNQGISANIPVTVVLGAPPVVTVTSPVEGTSVTVNSSQSLRATATSSNGTIASVQFFANGAPVGAPVAAAPFTTSWTPATEGAYRITATAVDNAGLSTSSPAVTVLAVPVAGASDAVFTGNFAGLGENGRFAAINVGGRDAILIGVPTTASGRAYYFPGLTPGASGGFSGNNAAGQPIITATTSETGVAGTFDGGRLTFIGPIVPASSGSSVAPGYYSGSLNGRGASTIAAIVASDGTIFIYGADGSFNDAGSGPVTAAGAFNVATPAGSRFTGTIDNRTGFVTGTLTGGPGGAFTAARASGAAFSDGSLRNLSTRGQVGTGANILIAGFVLKGSTAKQVLVRGIGPSLAGFGVSGSLSDPELQIFSGNTRLAGNDNWGGDAQVAMASARVGAFPLAAGARDAVLLVTLEPGAYTVQISGVGGATGVSLLELYDVDASTPFAAQKIMNVATRGVVGTGAGQQLIAGFVIDGTTAKKVLVRGAGPALSSLGLGSGALSDPVLRLIRHVDGSNLLVRENDNWETGNDSVLVADAAMTIGAFPFTAGGRDAAILLSLPPGTYSAEVTGANNTGGVALIEVYEVP